jgi:integrase
VTKLHVIRKQLKTGPRYYVYAWRGGPQIHVQDGTRPTITPDILDKARAARIEGKSNYPDSFEAVIDAYLASPEFDRLAKVTKEDYRRWLTRISKRFGNAPAAIMADFRMRKDILDWRDTYADQPRAADRAIGTLSTVLGWAAQRGMIASNIATGLGTLHRVNHADEIWEDRHWKAVKDVPTHIMQALQLGKMTGLRMGDLLGLDWAHIGPNAIVIRTSKRKVRAAIPMYRELKAFLDGVAGREGAVLRNSRGEAWTTSGFKSSWGSARPSGFDRRFHDLRGTCATWLAVKGLTDNEIATVLGWKAGRVSEIRARYVDEARTVISMAKRLNA